MNHLLIVSNMYPSEAAPYFGVFVERQVRALRRLGSACEVVASSERGGAPAASAQKYAGLAWKARRAAGQRPHAIIAHYAFPTGAAALAAAKGRDIPVTIVAHGGDVEASRSPRHKAAVRAVLSRADLVVAVSRAVARDCEALGATRCVVLNMGYDEATFFPRAQTEARARLGLPASSRYAVFVGNLIERKGLRALQIAAERLRGRLPDLEWLIIGGGDPRPWHGDGLRFLGAVAPGEVPWWLAAADVAVVPSLREPFGVAAVEAMSCGIPVVASRVGGLADLVQDHESGILIEPADADGLAAAVAAILEDQTLRARLSQGALNAAVPHTATRQAQLLLKALDQIASRR